MIVATGGLSYELGIGLPTIQLGHPEPAEGWPVYAAGQVTFINGVITRLNNSSGHYTHGGVPAFFVESIFNNNGINASSQYLELIFP